jgi:FkbM family methyltransferase
MSRLMPRVAKLLPPRAFVHLLAWQYALLEPELRHLDDFVPRHKIAVDVGTWWGPWSIHLARRVPRVEAFEPNGAIAATLSRVLPENVTLHTVALSDSPGHVTLWSPDGGRGTEGRSTVHQGPQIPDDWVHQTVETLPLDAFDLHDVGFVKIDVEGHELAVLRGAETLLSTQHPNLLVEIEEAHGSAEHMDEVMSFLTNLGYQATFLSKGGWRPFDELDRVETRRVGLRRKSMGLVRSSFSRTRYINNFLFTAAR